MTEGETKAPAPIEDKDFRKRDEALKEQIEQDEKTLTPKPPKVDHTWKGGVI